MFSDYKIAILGIGGVGGFYGGKLAAQFENSPEAEIIFISRGENERALKTQGLKLFTGEGEKIVHPAIVTHEPSEIGIIDLLLVCTKAYDLESALDRINSCIKAKTIILPLLNGVDAAERVKRIVPQAQVWEGVVYLVSRLLAPGVVKEFGNANQLFFGSEQAPEEKLVFVEKLFRKAGITAHRSENISRTVWEKFLFLSPLATLTSYLDLPFGGILSSVEHREELMILFSELKEVAAAKNILFPEESIGRIQNRISSLSPDYTSSMHSDFQKGNRTELKSLTGYVVELGKKLKIPTPTYEKMFLALKEKSTTTNLIQ